MMLLHPECIIYEWRLFSCTIEHFQSSAILARSFRICRVVFVSSSCLALAQKSGVANLGPCSFSSCNRPPSTLDIASYRLDDSTQTQLLGPVGCAALRGEARCRSPHPTQRHEGEGGTSLLRVSTLWLLALTHRSAWHGKFCSHPDREPSVKMVLTACEHGSPGTASSRACSD